MSKPLAFRSQHLWCKDTPKNWRSQPKILFKTSARFQIIISPITRRYRNKAPTREVLSVLLSATPALYTFEVVCLQILDSSTRSTLKTSKLHVKHRIVKQNSSSETLGAFSSIVSETENSNFLQISIHQCNSFEYHLKVIHFTESHK